MVIHQNVREGAGVQKRFACQLVPIVRDDAAQLEVVPEGVLVHSDQNMALIDGSGNKVYQKYFPAPKEGGMRKALLYASAIRAAYYTASYGYTSAAFGAASQQIEVQDAESAMAKDITGRISEVYGDAANAGMDATGRFLQQANARFFSHGEEPLGLCLKNVVGDLQDLDQALFDQPQGIIDCAYGDPT